MANLLNHAFVVGATYHDRVGAYRVVSIEDDRLAYEYSDGIRREGSAERKWCIHRSMVSDQRASHAALPSQRPRSNDDKGFFTHAEAFPIIAKAIETCSASHNKYMTHDKIVEAVMKDPQGQVILDRRPDKTKSWSAGVLVAWFSKVFTDGTSEWDGRFERKKMGSAWAYRVRRTKN